MFNNMNLYHHFKGHMISVCVCVYVCLFFQITLQKSFLPVCTPTVTWAHFHKPSQMLCHFII